MPLWQALNQVCSKNALGKPAKLRGTTVEKLLRSIGMGSKNVLLVEFAGLRKLDIHRLLQIADRLDVSLDRRMCRTEQRQIQP